MTSKNVLWKCFSPIHCWSWHEFTWLQFSSRAIRYSSIILEKKLTNLTQDLNIIWRMITYVLRQKMVHRMLNVTFLGKILAKFCYIVFGLIWFEFFHECLKSLFTMSLIMMVIRWTSWRWAVHAVVVIYFTSFLTFSNFHILIHEFFFYFQFFREMVSHVKLKVMRNEKSKPRWPSRAWYSQPLAASSLLDVLGNSMTLIATGSSLSKNDDGGRKIDNNLKEGVNYNWGKVKMMSIVTKIYISHNYCTQLLNVFFWNHKFWFKIISEKKTFKIHSFVLIHCLVKKSLGTISVNHDFSKQNAK